MIPALYWKTAPEVSTFGAVACRKDYPDYAEKVIDFLPLKKNDDSNTFNCDLQEWLNTTFFNLSFTDDEKDMFKTYNGKKVFLLSIDDYEIYYDILSDQKTEFTYFAKTSATNSNKTKC